MKFISASAKPAIAVLVAVAYSLYAHSIEYASQRLPTGLHLSPVYLLSQHILAWHLVVIILFLYHYVRERPSSFKDFSFFFRDYRELEATEAITLDDSKVCQRGRFTWPLAKLLCLGGLLSIALYSFMAGAASSPAYDNALMHNTSAFEIVTLMLAICGLVSSSARALFRTFVSASVSLLGIMVVSYYNSSADMLSGKYQINPLTGESSDVFLFDRLKSSLICGLGNLSLGPLMVLGDVWIVRNIRTNSVFKWTSTYFFLAFLNMCVSMLCMPFLFMSTAGERVHNEGTMPSLFSPWIIVSVLAIHLPAVVGLSYLWLTESTGALMSLPLINIVIMGIMRWFVERHSRIVTTGELFGYFILVVGLIATYNSYSK